MYDIERKLHRRATAAGMLSGGLRVQTSTSAYAAFSSVLAKCAALLWTTTTARTSAASASVCLSRFRTPYCIYAAEFAPPPSRIFRLVYAHLWPRSSPAGRRVEIAARVRCNSYQWVGLSGNQKGAYQSVYGAGIHDPSASRCGVAETADMRNIVSTRGGSANGTYL